MNINSERHLYDIRSFLHDVLIWGCIIFPILAGWWAIDFISMDVPYVVSARIKADRSEVMKIQVFYLMKGLNQDFSESYSVRQNLNLPKDQFTDLSVRLNSNKRILKKLRLDLGDVAGLTVTVKHLKVGDHSTEDISDSSKFAYHDLKLISSSLDGVVFQTTGSDPYIVSRQTLLSPLRIWIALFCLLVCAVLLLVSLHFKIQNKNEKYAHISITTTRTELTSDHKSDEKEGFSQSLFIFLYIAMPVFFLAWAFGFFSLNKPYEISADIRTDYTGVMNAQFFYIMDGLNGDYAEEYSERQDISLQQDCFSHLSIKLNRNKKALTNFRLDLGNMAGVLITVKNLNVGGQEIVYVGDTSKFNYHDLLVVSSSVADGTVFRSIGTDPFISSKHTEISPIRCGSEKIIMSTFISLFISITLFFAIRLPKVRRACGLVW